jgi:hypothetical protein
MKYLTYDNLKYSMISVIWYMTPYSFLEPCCNSLRNYQTTRCCIPGDSNLCIDGREKLISIVSKHVPAEQYGTIFFVDEAPRSFNFMN